MIDPDAGLNGEVVYTFGQGKNEIYFMYNFLNVTHPTDPPPQLYINSQTGLITVDVNNPLDYETNATLRFTVNATDMGSDPCTVCEHSQYIAILCVCVCC